MIGNWDIIIKKVKWLTVDDHRLLHEVLVDEAAHFAAIRSA